MAAGDQSGGNRPLSRVHIGKNRDVRFGSLKERVGAWRQTLAHFRGIYARHGAGEPLWLYPCVNDLAIDHDRHMELFEQWASRWGDHYEGGISFAAGSGLIRRKKKAWRLNVYTVGLTVRVGPGGVRTLQLANRPWWRDFMPAAREAAALLNPDQHRHMGLVEPSMEGTGDWIAYLAATLKGTDHVRVVYETEQLSAPVKASMVSIERIVAALESGAKRRPAWGVPQPKSWTQDELDEAIRGYIQKHVDIRNQLRDTICGGDSEERREAVQKARTLFGRNSMAKALGVKSQAMISKSVAWRALAAVLGLQGSRGPKGTRNTRPRGRVGMDIAVEHASRSQAAQRERELSEEANRLLSEAGYPEADSPPEEN